MPAAAITKRQNISRDYLGQILVTLKAAGVVTSTRGKDGGYTLAMEPSEILLASIVELTDPSLLATPTGTGQGTEGVEKCVITGIWTEITERVKAEFETITVQDICERIAATGYGQATDYAI